MLIQTICIIKLSVLSRSERIRLVAAVEDRQVLSQERVSVMKAFHTLRLRYFRLALNTTMDVTTSGSTTENDQIRITILGYSKVWRTLMIGQEFRDMNTYMEQSPQ
jgi:hypothetical protein